MLDVKIEGGTVVDGTGAPRYRADVGIRDGRIAAIGQVSEPTRTTLDARGRVVCPGFVDLHTHYDAQAFWDPALTPSSLHGVTTVFGGNCGFSLAPLVPSEGDYLMRMLARVEGMPLASLASGVPWDWTSFDEYLARLDGGLALNAGFLVGHSALRRVAMGERANRETASEADVARMVELLRASLAAGGMGFSSSSSPTHSDGDGGPVPSRHASRDEILALCAEVRHHPGTTLEFIPTAGPFEEAHKELMVEMSLAARRTLNWNMLVVTAMAPDLFEQQLETSDRAAKRGARVVALTLPNVLRMRINFTSGFVFDSLPGWGAVLAGTHDEKKRALADPAVRERLRGGYASPEAGVFAFLLTPDLLRIVETFTAAGKAVEGRTVGEVAAERGRDPFDVLFDLAVEEDLRTQFTPMVPGDDDESWRIRGEMWRDPRVLIGASDAGAHLDMIDTFNLPTQLLGPCVRERRLIGLEDAIHGITDRPARLYGVRERGRLAVGWHADVVVFDPDRIAPGPLHTRADLPGGASRLFGEAIGIDHVLVNGAEIVRGGELTGARPGTILRSGRDTETVPIPADGG
ncbi:MAG: amidohydrolase family protein [Deltaproteobacteria bacterium]|nr:amidohydrolase family protein [Deltaproteobacteria bacterium]